MLSQQAHPWHGVSPGPRAPETISCFIEIVPNDTVKYELDKESGLLKIDRPQRFSSLCPSLYGFIPRTLCAELVATRASERVGRMVPRGDGDPMDVCVLTEKSIPKGGFLLTARPIGGLRMLDGEEADDKIVAVLEGDLVYGDVLELNDLPHSLVDRLRHYFLTYKQIPSEGSRHVEIAEVYDSAEAREMIRRSCMDYDKHFPENF